MNAHALEFSQAFNYADLARYGRGVFLEVTLVANSHMTSTLRVRVIRQRPSACLAASGLTC